MFTYMPLGIKIYIWVMAFFTGAVMGSAMNCLAYRIVHEQKWSGGRSSCPYCGHTLAAKDLVPVFSFLLLKGKCRYCGAKLAKRYFLSEIFLGLCFMAVVAFYGFSLDTVSALVLVSCLFALSMVDLDTQIIPDRFLIISALVRLVQLVIEGRVLSGIIPALIFGGGMLVLSLVMDKILKKDTMGGGDIKLMAVLGLYFSVPVCLFLLILACFIGIIVAKLMMKVKKDVPFPFAPAISLATMVTMLVGERIVHWYMHLFW